MTPRRAALLVAVLALVAWLPSLRIGFLYDDERLLLDNRAIRELAHPGTVLRSDPTRPLLAVGWALNYAAAGYTPWPWHLVNVLVHGLNAALVALLAHALAQRRGDPDPTRTALLAGAFFALSPMLAETVGYVASRSTALCSAFVLAAVLAALPALETRAPRRLALATALFLAGLATKEEAAALPLLLLLVDVAFVARGDLAALRGRAGLHAAWLAVPLVGLVARRAVAGTWLPAPVHPLGAWLVAQAAAFPGYLLRAAVPVDPLFFRGAALDLSPLDALLALGGLALLAWSAFRVGRGSAAAFAVLWMAAALAPSSTLVVLKEPVVDHRAYLGTAAVAWLVGRFLAAPGRLPFAIAALALLAARAVHYQGVMAQPGRLWEHVVERRPQSAEARSQLAAFYVRDGDPRAEHALLDVVRLAPREARGWASLAAYYAGIGQVEAAARALRQAVALAPGDARLRHNLGLVLEGAGRPLDAIAELRAAVAAGPRLARPRIDLARLLIAHGDPEGARAALDEAARLEVDAEDIRVLEGLRARLAQSPASSRR